MTAVEQLDRTIRLCRDYVADELSNEQICGSLQSVRALCIADVQNLSSHSGQVALVTLASLMNRMGMQVGIQIPDVPMLCEQVPLVGDSLLTALIASSETYITGAKVTCDSGFSPDLIFVFGDTKFESGKTPSWTLSGDEWCGAVRMAGNGRITRWVHNWPIGAMVSAALAASEAFKFAIRRMQLRSQSDDVYFMPSSSFWDFGPARLYEQSLNLGKVDAISAGAITQAALYALLRIPHVQMEGKIFDHDETAATNLNRNMLSQLRDVGKRKVDVVARQCGTRLLLEPIAHRFGTGSYLPQLAPRVLVGVDDIPSRWRVQLQAKGWVGVCGTSHFSILSSSHSPRQACSGCLHPTDEAGAADPIPTISFVSFWAGLALAVRLIREATGDPYPAVRQQLWLTPLRMDLPSAARWLPIPPVMNCPVKCPASLARFLDDETSKPVYTV